MITTYLIYLQSLVVNKKQNLEIIIKRKFTTLMKDILYLELDLMNTCKE